MRFLCLLLVLLVGAAAPGRAEEPAVPQKHFCWKITGSDKGVVYLFGTIHVGTADFYPLPAAIEDAFKKSTVLVEEVNVSDQDDSQASVQFIKQYGVYPLGDFISNHLSEETRKYLAWYTDTNNMNPKVLMRLRPWLVGLMVGGVEIGRAGFAKKNGLDLHFANQAIQMKKPIIGLESNEGHLKLLASFNQTQQDQMLLISVFNAKKQVDELQQIVKMWKTGDADALAANLSDSVRKYPFLKPVMVRIVDERNDTMTQGIEGFLKTPKTYFVAVGAGHLGGDRGILNQLRQKNYKLEQM